MFITKKRFEKLEDFILTKISECETHIAKQEKINNQILKTLEAYNEDIKKLEIDRGLSTVENTLYEYLTPPKTKNNKNNKKGK